MTKFDMERTVHSLSDAEYEKLIRAIERHEGWDYGYEDFIEVQKIVGVRLDSQGVIAFKYRRYPNSSGGS